MQRILFSLCVSLLFLGVCYGRISKAEPTILPAPQADPWASYRSLLQGDTLEKQRGIFLQAYKFFQAKNQEGALLFFSRALEVYPQLEDHSLYYLGLLLQQQGRPHEALAHFQRLIDSHRESVWLPQATVEAGKIFLAGGNWEKALHYGKLARSASLSSLWVEAEATLLMAHARQGQGKVTSAYSLYQAVRKQQPVSAPGEEARARVYELRNSHPDLFSLTTEKDFLSEGRLLLKERDITGLERIVARYTNKFSTGRRHPEMLRLLTQAYRKEKKTSKVVPLLEEITTRYPNSRAAPEALHAWATILWNQDRDREALKLFERLVQQYPQHKLAADSLYAVGRIYQKEGNNAPATDAYTKLAARFPHNPLAQEGKWRQGWMAYRHDDFHRAQMLFSGLVRQAAGTTSGKAALYWQARSAEHAGEKDQAARLYRRLLQQYPYSYYALWAEKRLNAPLAPLALNNADSAPTLNLTSFAPEARSHFLRSQELKALGLLLLARRELNAFAQEMPRGSSFLRLLLREYISVDGYTTALRLAQSRGRPGSSVWQEYLYPRAYWQTVEMLATEKGLDPYLILALMRQESLFDPEAVSSAGALGLMQLLPTTAAKLTSEAHSLTNP